MKVIKTNSYEETSKRAAEIIAEQIRNKPNSVIGLATGSSPIGTYDELVKMNLDFSKVSTVNLDEYYGIAPENDQSYRYFMNKNLFDRINICKENTFVPDGLTKDPEKHCAEYDQNILDLGGIDLQVLGIGHNGHIGFNEPDDHFPVGTHLVDLQESTIEANSRFFTSKDDVPTQALSMGMKPIMNARKIVMVVHGKDKEDALTKSLHGPVTPQMPASILQLHPDVTIIYCY